MKTDMKDAAIFQGRKHFDLLDGLRGVAAIAIVVFHFTEYIFTDYGKNFIGHGFLAVDFFFCLSGFVIGYAYDGRIGKIGIKQFFISARCKRACIYYRLWYHIADRLRVVMDEML